MNRIRRERIEINLSLFINTFYLTPKAISIFSKGQNLVTELCSKFAPTNTPSHIQLGLTVDVSRILISTKLPATALTILSLIFLY